jgi:hypothetical protein
VDLQFSGVWRSAVRVARADSSQPLHAKEEEEESTSIAPEIELLSYRRPFHSADFSPAVRASLVCGRRRCGLVLERRARRGPGQSDAWPPCGFLWHSLCGPFCTTSAVPPASGRTGILEAISFGMKTNILVSIRGLYLIC